MNLKPQKADQNKMIVVTGTERRAQKPNQYKRHDVKSAEQTAEKPVGMPTIL